MDLQDAFLQLALLGIAEEEADPGEDRRHGSCYRTNRRTSSLSTGVSSRSRRTTEDPMIVWARDTPYDTKCSRPEWFLSTNEDGRVSVVAG